jgi:hypothetical protein
MNKSLFLTLSFFLLTTTAFAEPVPPATNKDGSPVSGFLTADFDLRPGQEALPFPTNFLFGRTNPDLTLDVPIDPTNPVAALNAMDGWSTTERWITTFSSFPNQVDPNSVVTGQSVRLFEVSTVFGTIVIVNGIVRELTPGVDYFATMATDDVLAILPLKPLKELTTYMAVVTNDINDTAGNDATPSQFYHLTKAQTPWVDESGKSTTPFFDDATAATLEGARQITASMEAVADAAGIPKEDIILSWTVQTQSITPTMKALRSIARPAPTQFVPTGMNTSILGAPGIADIHIGVITIPYYLGVPSAANPVAPLTDSWRAAPGAYIPPFDTLGLDPTSTNVTVANPFPVKTSDQTIPVLLTLPNANSGHEKPAAGWPVVIFGHGLRGNRATLLYAADQFAAAGFAVIGIDSPLHGILPDDPMLGMLYVGNTPWADTANERTFNVDLIDNSTGAPGPDGKIDPSGAHWINLGSMLTGRDNWRQGETDLSSLAVSIALIDADGDSLPDLDGGNISYAGISLGGMLGTVFSAIEPLVKNAFLSVPMGGYVRGGEASPSFGPIIRAGLAQAGVFPGTADYELFFTAAQTVADSSDMINWIGEGVRLRNVLLHEVIGDVVNPNFVPTAPLSGTEPMIAAGGLPGYSSTVTNAAGVDGAGRFLPPATHGSLLDPTSSPAATAEMQKQMVTFIASGGTVIPVEDASTMVPIPPPGTEADSAKEESP